MRGRSEPADATPSIDGSCGAILESNASLARRIMAQENGAFTLLVERYHDFVFRICFAILRHRQDAEDATQDTFSRVAKYLDRWDPRRPLEPWLATVAGNRSRSHLARRKVYAPLTAADEPESLATTTPPMRCVKKSRWPSEIFPTGNASRLNPFMSNRCPTSKSLDRCNARSAP